MRWRWLAVLALVATSVGCGGQGFAPALPDRPIRVLVVGDSVQFQLALGLGQWASEHPGYLEVHSDAALGCGLVRGGLRRVPDAADPGTTYVESVTERCDGWAEAASPAAGETVEVVSWPAALARWRPDVVVASPSTWDVADRLIPTVLGNDWHWIGQPETDAYYRDELAAAQRLLASTGATVVWLRLPHVGRLRQPQNDPARVDRLNALAERVLDDTGVPHEVLDLPEFIGTVGAPRDRTIRPDGLHYSATGALEVAAWVGRELVATGE